MANAPQVKFQPTPANVGGIPKIISVPASGLNLQSRTFWGAGAPSASTLQAGPQVTNAGSMYLAAVAGVSAPDMYFDVTNFALYLCTTSGTNATAVWKQISGSGAGATISFSIYASGSNYSPGNIVRVTTTSVVNGVALTPGTYMCVQPVIAPPSPNMVPQFPEPTSGIIYWYWIGFLGQVVNICENGSEQIYIQSTAAF